MLDANIKYVVDLAAKRTPAEEVAAYYDDRRNQSYGAVDGLGSLQTFIARSPETYMTITSIPADALTKKYDDGNGSNKAGNSDSELGKMVDLIGTLRGGAASTTPAKNFYKYPRPFRWANDTSIIVLNVGSCDHHPPRRTAASRVADIRTHPDLAAFALACAVPERFQELMTRASEMGNNWS